MQTLARWKKSGPAVFAIEALGATPEAWQVDAGEKLVKTRRVSVRSGHGVGKTAFEAWTILWFMATHYPCKVPCTAPTSHQLSDVLWAEVAKWLRVLRERLPELGNEFEWKSDVIELKAAPKESFAVARTSRPEQPEALQGFHSENILFVLDEASGIPEAVFEVAQGALSSEGAYVLMCANPTRMEGYFYRSHHEMRDRWSAIHVNGEHCARVSKEYIEDMAKQYGADSPIYKVRVKGDFVGSLDGVIPLDIVETAIDRKIKQHGEMRWGLDVARFGEDRSALAKRHNSHLVEPIKWWRGKDTMQTVGLLKMEYDRADIKPTAIFVDVIGLGAGVVDRARELDLPIVAVNVAESPSVEDKYSRLRDELWFRAREWFQSREVCIVRDEALIAELTLPTYKFLSTGKLQVESKDDLKRRGVTSPDLADAFILTFANGGVSKWRKAIQYDNRGIH